MIQPLKLHERKALAYIFAVGNAPNTSEVCQAISMADQDSQFLKELEGRGLLDNMGDSYGFHAEWEITDEGCERLFNDQDWNVDTEEGEE